MLDSFSAFIAHAIRGVWFVLASVFTWLPPLWLRIVIVAIALAIGALWVRSLFRRGVQ